MCEPQRREEGVALWTSKREGWYGPHTAWVSVCLPDVFLTQRMAGGFLILYGENGNWINKKKSLIIQIIITRLFQERAPCKCAFNRMESLRLPFLNQVSIALIIAIAVAFAISQQTSRHTQDCGKWVCNMKWILGNTSWRRVWSLEQEC